MFIQPPNSENGKRCIKNIADKKRHLEQSVLKKMLRPFIEFKLGVYYLFQRIKNNDKSDKNKIKINAK